MWLLRRTESWMQESGESSSALQLSSSSGRVPGMTGEAHEVSSSGASSRSQSRQERRNSSPYPMPRLPPMPRSQPAGNIGNLDVRVPSSESASSMPPLEDARDFGDVIMDGSTSVLNQSYHDERVYQDHRSVHLHSVEPAAYEQMAQMAAQARVSDLRNEAQQVVTGVVNEAERAVRSAQSEASHANMRAEATHALANQEVEHLRRQLEHAMSENQDLRARCFQQRPDPLNGAGMFTARMIAMEERMRVLEDQLNQHHTFIQELWIRPQQSLVSQVLQPSQVHTPVHRAQTPSPTHFNIGENENESGDDEDANNNAEDVESKALRTKDLHHLKVPPLPDSAAGYRTWRNSVRTALLAFDRSTEGILGSWLSKAFTARGQEAVELSRDSGSFPRCDRVIASVLCRQETLKSNFGLRIQAYVEKCESEQAIVLFIASADVHATVPGV